MNKSERAVKEMISYFDDNLSTWRSYPDDIQSMFLEAEKEINENPPSVYDCKPSKEIIDHLSLNNKKT